jgi:hypothetical protein
VTPSARVSLYRVLPTAQSPLDRDLAGLRKQGQKTQGSNAATSLRKKRSSAETLKRADDRAEHS